MLNHSLFSPFPSSKRYKTLKTHASRFRNSSFPLQRGAHQVNAQQGGFNAYLGRCPGYCQAALVLAIFPAGVISKFHPIILCFNKYSEQLHSQHKFLLNTNDHTLSIFFISASDRWSNFPAKSITCHPIFKLQFQLSFLWSAFLSNTKLKRCFLRCLYCGATNAIFISNLIFPKSK